MLCPLNILWEKKRVDTFIRKDMLQSAFQEGLVGALLIHCSSVILCTTSLCNMCEFGLMMYLSFMHAA